MLETNPRTVLVGPQAWFANGQTVRLLIALSLLLIALTVVIVKDRDFWFGSDETSESRRGLGKHPEIRLGCGAPAQVPLARAAAVKSHLVPKASTAAAPDSSRKDDTSPVSANPVSANPVSANPASPVVATNRVVLPSLDVEVVAGDSHRIVHPGSNVAKVEIPNDSNRTSAVPPSVVTLATNAAEHERLSSESVPELRQTVETTYPLLGQHMRVQGSVVLQAVVGTDGTIENLRVLSGPAILATAAQQAVRQWRFKPYLQNGQPVETKTKITVNFSIRISDNAKTS